jgi:hypothetical protein
MQSVVEGLCAISGRGACTDAERRAAVWLHDELRSSGHEAWVETRWVRPQRYAMLALGCLLAVAGSLLSTFAAAAGLAGAAVGAAVLALRAVGWALPLFPRRATQHVLTEVPDGTDRNGARGGREPRGVLVIAAAYDAPRRGLLLNDRWRHRLRPRSGLAACAVAVAGAAGARLGGVEETWLGALQLVPTVVLLVAFAAAVDIALSGFSPGANDNASGVAVALALFDELRRQPPRALAPALLLVGAGHAVPRAVAAHLRAERLDGVVLEIGPCGDGVPVESGRRPAGVRIAGADTRAHQADDTAEHVSPAAMEATLDLALGVVAALDAELSAAAPAASRPG